MLTGSLALALAVGTAFYQRVEGWSALDALYFCVVTLATVGYGDLSPKTDLGRVFTMGYIVVGIGLLAGVVQVLARRWVDRRIRRIGQKQPPTEPAPRSQRPQLTHMTRVRRARRRAASNRPAAPPAEPSTSTTPG